MERVALDGELGHLGIRDLDALGIAAGVDLAADGQAGLGGRGADQLNDDPMLTSGLPRQFREMGAKSRCSILFHLLVPGGRCATVTARPVSSAKRCSSRFHSRTRAPLLPPQSAVMTSRLASGSRALPSLHHQRRMLSTAKAAVSASTPTLTQPALAARS